MDSQRFDLAANLILAVALVRQHSIVIWWLVFIGLLNTMTTLLGDTEFARSLGIVSFIISLCSTPVIYGIYYELIENNYSSVTSIIKSYTLPYLWLIVRMYVPVIILAWMPMILYPQSAGGGYFHIILVSFSLLYLYVVPFFYFTGRQQGSISIGIRFLYQNIGPSTPLLFIVLLLETTLLLVQYNKTALLHHSTLLFTFLDFSTYFFASVIDFVLFIILICILKNDFGRID